MVKDFFVVYCTEALRQPKLYKLQSYAIKRCMENPKLNFKNFPEEHLADAFFQQMRNQYLQTNRTSCLDILKNSLVNNSNIQILPQPPEDKNKFKRIQKRQNLAAKNDKNMLIKSFYMENYLKLLFLNRLLKDHFLGYFDAFSKGNPRIAGIGHHIDTANNYKTVIQRCEFVRNFRTNNQSELIALNFLLADAYCNNIKNLKVFEDSQLAIRWMTGAYRAHNPYLSSIVQSAFSIAKHIPNISFQHIVRAFNAKADKLSNKALQPKNKQRNNYSIKWLELTLKQIMIIILQFLVYSPTYYILKNT